MLTVESHEAQLTLFILYCTFKEISYLLPQALLYCHDIIAANIV